jgi:putative endonuclease
MLAVIPAYAGSSIVRVQTGTPDRSIMRKQFYVYILANARNGTLYTGMTSNLAQRIWQHRQSVAEEFTTKYGVKKLVYYEVHDNPESAITREKQIKKWRRVWKLDLIESRNPDWKDLYELIAS